MEWASSAVQIQNNSNFLFWSRIATEIIKSNVQPVLSRFSNSLDQVLIQFGRNVCLGWPDPWHLTLPDLEVPSDGIQSFKSDSQHNLLYSVLMFFPDEILFEPVPQDSGPLTARIAQFDHVQQTKIKEANHILDITVLLPLMMFFLMTCLSNTVGTCAWMILTLDNSNYPIWNNLAAGINKTDFTLDLCCLSVFV